MGIKKIVFVITSLFFIACSGSDEVNIPSTLEAYLNDNKNVTFGTVIACAASKNEEANVSYIFYYPEEGATNIQYFETENTLVAKDDYHLYDPLTLEKEPVFNGYLQRFVRDSFTESWGVVTYELNGEVRVSNPIRLKNTTIPTEWSNEVVINTEASLMPLFSWEDGLVKENEIYFQVLSTELNDFISGTYTFNNWFQFYKLDNVVLNITNEVNPLLEENKMYNFTMMGVSIDNWVNLVVQKTFIAE